MRSPKNCFHKNRCFGRNYTSYRTTHIDRLIVVTRLEHAALLRAHVQGRCAFVWEDRNVWASFFLLRHLS